MPVIDLQSLTEKTIDFIWVDGQPLHLEQPSVRFVNKVNRAENTVEKAEELVLEWIQHNKEGRKFTAEEVSELNASQLTAILMAALGLAQEVDQHPN
ncbi:hypothetical protein [Enterococcus sp. LJL90]